MSDKTKHQVRFEPDGVTVTVADGANLMQAAIAAGVHINANCGGTGTCGTCNVLVREGKVEGARTSRVSPADYARGVRQSCQSKVTSDLVVEIPATSRLEAAVLASEKLGGVGAGQPLAAGWRFAPPLRKLLLTLPPPSANDNASDLTRLRRTLAQAHNIESITVDFSVVEHLAHAARKGRWQVTATVLDTEAGPRLTHLEAGDTRQSNLALAFDIGTTAVRGQLLDLARGRVLAQAIDYNGQISYGADVISRIVACQAPGGLPKLQQAVVATLNKLTAEMAAQASVPIESLGYVMVAANTVMVHLLLGLSPQHLRLSPYVPVATDVPPVKAKELGLAVGPDVYLQTIPGVASYVGGDIVAGIVGTGIYQRPLVTLYIDIGTNGEIVAGNQDWLVTSAASAGPTFEGGGIKHGMLATTGAIQDFELDKKTMEPVITTIGGARPRGICGSGLINMAAVMLRAGLIDQNGRFNSDCKTPRLRPGADGTEYVLARGSESETGQDIVFTEADLQNLIRAKAAMFAGAQTLLAGLGGGVESIDEVVIAGTFGSRLNVENAITIGLLPDLPRDKFVFIGNGSLLGARLAAFSADLLRDAGRVAAKMTSIELSENKDFMENYVAAMFLPHTDAGKLFPSVKLEGCL